MLLEVDHVWGLGSQTFLSLQTAYPRREWLQALRKLGRDLGWLRSLLQRVLSARLSYMTIKIK